MSISQEIRRIREEIRNMGKLADKASLAGHEASADYLREEGKKMAEQLMALFREQHEKEPIAPLDDPVIRDYLRSKGVGTA